MEHDQERPIEKLLRGAAKDRREQAGGSWELHPATRRLLEGEVARRYPRASEPSGSWSWRRLMPRFAWAAGLCAVLALGFYAVLPEKNQPSVTSVQQEKSMELAAKPAAPSPLAESKERGPVLGDRVNASQPDATMNDVSESGDPAGKAGSEMASRKAKAESNTQWSHIETSSLETFPLRRVAPTKDLTDQSAERVPNTEQSPLLTTTSVIQNGVIAEKSSDESISAGLSPQKVPAAAAPPPQSKPESQAFYGRFQSAPEQGRLALRGMPAPERGVSGGAAPSVSDSEASTKATRSYGSLAAVPDKTASAGRAAFLAQETGILDNFAVNQEGREVVVVDNDGSVYRGRVEMANDKGIESSTLFCAGYGATTGSYFNSELSNPIVTNGAVLGLNGGAYASQEVQTTSTNSISLNFSVQGTNKTHGKKVEFAGKLLFANSNNVQNSFQNNFQNNAPLNAFQNQVMGRARIDGMPSIQVNAFQMQAPANQTSPGSLPKPPDTQ